MVTSSSSSSSSYQRSNGGGSSTSSYVSSRVQLTAAQQAKLIEDRIAEHSYHVQTVEALMVFAFVYVKELKTTMNGNTYCDVDFQIVYESTDDARKSEYIGARIWGEEAQALQQCQPYLTTDRGKSRPVLISYSPARLTADIGVNKQGQPQAYLKADRVVIFLDITNTLVVSSRAQSDEGEASAEEAVAQTATSSYNETDLDNDPF